MDGSFLELNADSCLADVEDYIKEIFKVQKIFLTKLKKMQAHRDEKEEERKRRKNRKAAAGADAAPEGDQVDLNVPVPMVVPPAAVGVCTVVLEQMNQFKVRLLFN